MMGLFTLLHHKYRKCLYILILSNIVIFLLLLFNDRIPLIRNRNTQKVQYEDPFGLGHRNASILFNRKFHQDKNQRNEIHTNIAIGLGITSKGIKDVHEDNVRYRFPFFNSLLTSLCRTTSQGYGYHFYLAYDDNDYFFNNDTSREWFVNTYKEVKDEICSYVSTLRLQLIRCRHAHKPAWAQNDAMFEAYLDNMDYYYRINDDTWIKTPGWTDRFVTALKSMEPGNVGVVGPKHESGKTNILTYDFVHRTHIDIFGFYYPRSFTDWWGDDWITSVYQPGRSQKILDTKVIHTQQLGTRYDNQFGTVQFLSGEVATGKQILLQYISHLEMLNSTKTIDRTQSSSGNVPVISMSLYGNDTDKLYGSIRNVLLQKIHFPQWKVRIYMENPMKNGSQTKVPVKIYRKLDFLNASLVFVNEDVARSIIPELWSYLVIDDINVSTFVIREPDGRLNQRDYEVVRDWLDSKFAVHCIRDHSSHMDTPIVHGLWGAKNSFLRRVLTKRMEDHLKDFSKTQGNLAFDRDSFHQFLRETLWNKSKADMLCHDSVSCKKWDNSVRFPHRRKSHEYLGQKLDAWGMLKSGNYTLEHENPQCV